MSFLVRSKWVQIATVSLCSNLDPAFPRVAMEQEHSTRVPVWLATLPTQHHSLKFFTLQQNF